jgi:hypothetical protein
MEQNRQTPEQRQNATEKTFVIETLYDVRQELARRRGIPECSEIPFDAHASWDDTATNTHHAYSFITAYDRNDSEYRYHLSHAEDTVSQFMYLDPHLQNRILTQLLVKSEQGQSQGDIDADRYIASIRRLDALANGDPSTTYPSDLQSLIRYTQRIETQYRSNDIDCVITKKIVIQELLDEQVLSETVYGGHGDDELMDMSFEDMSGLFYALDEKLSYSDVDEDIPEIIEYLYYLNFTTGKLRCEQEAR